MGNASAKRPLGLQKFAQISHKVFSLLFSLRNGGEKPSRSDDTFLKGYAGMKERKREGSLCDRKMQGLGRVG